MKAGWYVMLADGYFVDRRHWGRCKLCELLFARYLSTAYIRFLGLKYWLRLTVFTQHFHVWPFIRNTHLETFSNWKYLEMRKISFVTKLIRESIQNVFSRDICSNLNGKCENLMSASEKSPIIRFNLKIFENNKLEIWITEKCDVGICK